MNNNEWVIAKALVAHEVTHIFAQIVYHINCEITH